MPLNLFQKAFGVCKDTRPWPYNNLSTWITSVTWDNLMSLATSLKTHKTGSEPAHESPADIYILVALILTGFQRHQMKKWTYLPHLKKRRRVTDALFCFNQNTSAFFRNDLPHRKRAPRSSWGCSCWGGRRRREPGLLPAQTTALAALRPSSVTPSRGRRGHTQHGPRFFTSRFAFLYLISLPRYLSGKRCVFVENAIANTDTSVRRKCMANCVAV